MTSQLEQDAESSKVEFKAMCDQLNALAVTMMMASLVPNGSKAQHQALRMANKNLNSMYVHFLEIMTLAGLQVEPIGD